MHVVQLGAGAAPSIPGQTGMLKAGKQHKPDSTHWALPGASEQPVLGGGWECPL